MEIIEITPAYTDHRGMITDLLNGVELRHIGLMFSKAGSVRGNHYHKLSAQYLYVISGKLEFVAREHGEEVERTILNPGEMVLTGPFCDHAMEFLEDSEVLTFTTHARDDGGYEDDTIRLEEPLIPAN